MKPRLLTVVNLLNPFVLAFEDLINREIVRKVFLNLTVYLDFCDL